jgi:hypothetical protein
MEVLYPRCEGLDVHKDLVVACVRIADGRRVDTALRESGTTRRELLALLDWLSSYHVTHVAMESTSPRRRVGSCTVRSGGMNSRVRGSGYVWQIGEAKGRGPVPVTYLIGIPPA